MKAFIFFIVIIYLNQSLVQGSVKTKTSTNSRYQSRFESHEGGSQGTSKGRSEITARRCDRPLPPESGSIRCGMDNDIYTCTGECEEGYKFPDGSTTFKLNCNKNTGFWEPQISFPPCQRSRGGNIKTQTYYKGSSSSHSQTSDRYTDLSSSNLLQQESLCKPLQPPQNGRKECRMSNGDWTCKVTCLSGFQFPDGSTELQVTCNDRIGNWSPKDTFEDCKSASGGNVGYNQYQQTRTVSGSHSFNSHQIENDYGGSENYNQGYFGGFGEDKCPKLQSPTNAAKHCRMSNGDWSCQIKCIDGYQFSNGNKELTVTCNSRIGRWLPTSSFEDCQAISGGSSVKTFHRQENYGGSSGSAYEFIDDKCPEIQSPMNGGKQCQMSNGEWSCKIKCRDGYKFSDGNKELTVTCISRVGLWLPTSSFGDCQAISDGSSIKTIHQQQNYGGSSGSAYEFIDDKCPEIQSPMNGGKQCQMSNGEWSCKIKCRDGYQLSDGNKELIVTCNSRIGLWLPTRSFGDCQAISGGGSSIKTVHQQQNYGGVSGAVYNFEGDRCPKIQSPINAAKQCRMTNGDWSCQIKCMEGYQFPDGTTETTITCNSQVGQWLPRSTFEDCKSISGENYVKSFHQQQTFEGSSGSTYNFNDDRCPSVKSPMNGAKQCTMSNGDWKCLISCMNGYKFPDGNTELTITCNSRIGQWLPSNNYPDCISISGGNYLEGFHQQQISESSGGSYSSYNQQGGSQVKSHSNYTGGSYSGYNQQGGSSVKGHGNYGQINQVSTICKDPLAPKNGFIHCSGFNGQRTCQVTCNPGYEFSDRSRQLNINCYESSGRWTPTKNFGDCQLLCHPPCENGATCLTLNQCSCTENFRGNRCQYSVSLCDFNKLSSGNVIADCKHNPEYTECQVACPPGSTFNPPSTSLYRCTVNGLWNPPIAPRCSAEREELCKSPPPPDNGRIRCVTNSDTMECTGTCRTGYTFENGFLELSIQCSKRTGEWTPDIGFPNCQPICSPECINGGKCIGHNSCLCPSGFRGDRCEYALNLCDAHNRLASVVWECQNTQKETICNIKCNRGQKLQPGHTTVYKCRIDGTWEPNLKPTCVLAVSEPLIDPRAPQHNRSKQTSRTSSFSHQNTYQYDYYDQQQDISDLQQTYQEHKFRPYGENTQHQEFSQNSIDADYDFTHDTSQHGKWQKTHIQEPEIKSERITKQQKVYTREQQGLEQFDMNDINQHKTEYSKKTNYGQKTNRNAYEFTDQDPQKKVNTFMRKNYFSLK